MFNFKSNWRKWSYSSVQLLFIVPLFDLIWFFFLREGGEFLRNLLELFCIVNKIQEKLECAVTIQLIFAKKNNNM